MGDPEQILWRPIRWNVAGEQNSSAEVAAGSSSAQSIEERARASLHADVAVFKEWLLKESCAALQDLDLDDTARKGIVEACKVALEHTEQAIKSKNTADPFAGFSVSWTGPLPSLLADIVQKTGVGVGLAALKKEVERVGSAYESAVAALAIRDEVRGYVGSDVEAFEKFLRETLDSEAEKSLDIADIASKGIVEALDIALRCWDNDGDFTAFQDQWEGPIPKGLVSIIDAVQGGGTGMVVHLLVKEKLGVLRDAYLQAVCARPPVTSVSAATRKSSVAI